MSTGKKNIKSNRFAQIARLDAELFHAKDLANLWRIKNQNTLHTTLTRYFKQGLLFRIYRGLYSIKPLEQINPYLLGIKALHQYSYISAETVLFQTGAISQPGRYITIVSSKSKKFFIGKNNYFSRQLADKFLYNPIGVFENNKIRTADASRAAADLLYFNPKAFFDNPSAIKWSEVKKYQKKLGYDITKPKRG